MIFSTLIAKEIMPAGVSENEHTFRLNPNPVIPNPDSCRAQIDRMVYEIESPEVREIMGTIFGDLLRLLECLSPLENRLRRVESAEETLALFQIIHDEAKVLVEFIRDKGLNCGAMNEELIDTLDGVTFAVSHDLQRVFDSEHRKFASAKAGPMVVGRLYRAHDVLTNCLQQSTITLAMVFDPEMVGTRLFNNSDMRYRQSLQLCEELSSLMHIIEDGEKKRDESALTTLSARIEEFCDNSLECLMYSDWPQFESFCERIKVARASGPELESVLHQFHCYLETLLSQVRMRAVLANVFPMQSGANDTGQSSLESSAQLSASFELQEANAPWDALAQAV